MKAGVPISAFETADPQATIVACQRAMNGDALPCMGWDCIRGAHAVTSTASGIVARYGEPIDTQNFPQFLSKVAADPVKNTVLFAHAANRVLEDWTAAQAIWNLRDVYKGIGSHIVLLGPSIKLPPELANDVPTFEEPVPTEPEIIAKIQSLVKDAGIPAPDENTQSKIVDTLTGYLAMFGMEQSLALSVTKQGFDLRRLWQLKVANLKTTAGLEISQPTETFDNLAGSFGVKSFLNLLINGRERFKGVFFLDEIEKMLAGGQGDLSGTSQAMIEQFLYWTEAKRVLGLLLIGVPGAGKSHTARCTAGQAGVPLLRGSMSTVKGSLVGQSEANMKAMLKTIDTVTAGRTLMIATCNSLDALTPEIMARFKLGTIFYDYPTAEESNALWKLYAKQYGLGEFNVPDTAVNWVGREIESCCHRAWLFNVSIDEAAKSIVPVCRANKDKMNALRRSVSGRFLSAAQPGVYTFEENPSVEQPTGRRFKV